MQRFYMFHSFIKFHRNYIAAAALFLAAKVAQRIQLEAQFLSSLYLLQERPSKDNINPNPGGGTTKEAGTRNQGWS